MKAGSSMYKVNPPPPLFYLSLAFDGAQMMRTGRRVAGKECGVTGGKKDHRGQAQQGSEGHRGKIPSSYRAESVLGVQFRTGDIEGLADSLSPCLNLQQHNGRGG